MQVINTDLAPSAIGAYNQAVICGNMAYLSGQIPLMPETMQLCSEDIRLQIQQVFDNLSAVCQASGGSLDSIVKLTVYLTDLGHFNVVNELMMQNFARPYPARAAIGVSALPKGAQVEMDAIMSVD